MLLLACAQHRLTKISQLCNTLLSLYFFSFDMTWEWKVCVDVYTNYRKPNK